ncbi:hypothetical protein BH09ACT12_BH09ACT12_02460 [soil metagenome]
MLAHLPEGLVKVLGREARRLRRVERDPRLATRSDIESLVRAHGVPEQGVWAVADRVEVAGLDPSAIWEWTMHFDGVTLADLCASDLTHAEVVEHLHQRSGVFAGLGYAA